MVSVTTIAGIILGMDSDNSKQQYIAISSLIGWVYTQKIPALEQTVVRCTGSL